MKTGKKRRNSLEKVVNKTAYYGCVFLSEKYKTCKHVYNFLCNCGNKFECSYDDFLSGQRCSLCGKRNRDAANRYSLEEVVNLFTSKNCVFLSKEYSNSSQRYEFLCECGKTDSLTVTSFIRGQRCKDCGRKRIGKALRLLTDEVKQQYLDKGCKFLDEEFLGVHHLHKFQCACGNIHFTRLNDFKKGARCLDCAESGFNKAKPAFLYLIAKPGQIKVGIYNEGTRRLNKHQSNGWLLLEQKHFKSGLHAYDEEQNILKLLDVKGILRGRKAFVEPFDGYTEAWNAADLYVESFEGLFQKLSSQKLLDCITTFG
jgi:hypothetical protein